MEEPNIKYSIIRYRHQQPCECLANSLCALCEKQFELDYNLDVEFSAERLDNMFRAFMGKTEERPLRKKDMMRFISRDGLIDEKSGKVFENMTFYRAPSVDQEDIKKHLIEKGCLQLSIRTWTRKWKERKFRSFHGEKQLRVPDKFKIKGGHSILIVGFDAIRGWEILDSHYDFTYFLAVKDLPKIKKSLYYLKI